MYAAERLTLSEFAFLTENTKGRDKPIPPCPIRTEFERDRDRITHSKAFRRLMHKTQVFLGPEDDHFRTRMSHTLEVTQIARTISRALRLNETLTEAIALGHDLGHTPFGHAGERVLQRCYSPDFTHYKQSLRVVEKLENEGEGLNLTWEVRDGIVNHTGSNVASTLEGVVVKFADRIAYINHDIDDAERAKILHPEDIPKELREILGNSSSERIASMVSSVVNASEGKNRITMEDYVLDATNSLRSFLFQTVYTNPIAKGEETKVDVMLEKMYEHFVKHPDEMGAEFKKQLEHESVERVVCDYIAGMTDRYALNKYKDIFLPKMWK
ncbi:MAG: deoxyguanosinetriphosphate triphosphohydrolase [Ruminococcaceae bacterium]|nr:deoxyguanosinetriphosphate triphosphohydrolase [Oscillospiraceae bacterium]